MQSRFGLALIVFLAFLGTVSHASSFAEIKSTGNAHFEANRIDEALSHYQLAISVAATPEETAIAYANIGQCYRKKKEWVQALENFDRARDFDPHHFKALYWSAKLRFPALTGDEQSVVDDILKTAITVYPHDKMMRTLFAEFEMLKSGGRAAPDVSYLPDFLTTEELAELRGIFSRGTWGRVKASNSTGLRCADGDKDKFEALLGPISDRLKAYGLVPNVKELGYVVIRYERGGHLKQHKDHKKRVDNFVLGINVGGPCNIDFVFDDDKHQTSLKLESKSVFVMEGKSHDVCTHGISNVLDTRYSLLFYVPAPEDGFEKRFDLERKKFVTPPSSNFCICGSCGSSMTQLVDIIRIISIFSSFSHNDAASGFTRPLDRL